MSNTDLHWFTLVQLRHMETELLVTLTDSHEVVKDLKPLNPYGDSKNDFDKWALEQEHKPYFWAGLKFFNVYGPNEGHKNRMASVVLHTFRQVNETGGMNLFRSHNPDFKDGEQTRDFVYVKDVTKVCFT